MDTVRLVIKKGSFRHVEYEDDAERDWSKTCTMI